VSAATSYFFESSRREALTAGAPTELVAVEPSVLLLPDASHVARAADALDGLFFATMIASNPHSYVNASNFVQFSQSVDTEESGALARRTRTLFGSATLDTRVEHLIETRPAWCGAYYTHDSDALRLFEAVAGREEAEPVRECIRALHGAMSDSDGFEPDIEHAFYARALERLLARDDQTQSNRAEKQREVATNLLQPILAQVAMLTETPTVELRPFPLESPRIVAALEWIRDDRNAAWHPQTRASRSPLRDQLVLRPNVVAFRVVSALVIGTMANLVPTLLTPALRSYVTALRTLAGRPYRRLADDAGACAQPLRSAPFEVSLAIQSPANA